jgi:hypothetical protein
VDCTEFYTAPPAAASTCASNGEAKHTRMFNIEVELDTSCGCKSTGDCAGLPPAHFAFPPQLQFLLQAD